MIAVRPLTDHRDVVRAYRELFPSVYQGIAGWHAPPMAFHLARLDPAQEPIWRDAERLLLVVERDGKAVGRLLVFVPAGPRDPGPRVGRFAFFDAVDERGPVDALFDRALSWLRERGCATVEGPYAFSIHDEVGLLVEGFDRPPAFLMPFNPPCAEAHLLRLGFEPMRSFGSAEWKLDRDRVPVRADRRDLATPPGLSLRAFSLARREEETRAIVEVYNDAFARSWGFVPLALESARAMVDQLIRFGDPRIVRIAEVGGRPVGFALAVPDPHAHLHSTRGQPDWLRLARLMLAVKLRRLRHARLMTLAVRPEHRGKGVAHALVRDIAAAGIPLGYRTAELSYVDDGNDAMNGILRAFSLPRTKRYVLYRRAIP